MKINIKLAILTVAMSLAVASCVTGIKEDVTPPTPTLLPQDGAAMLAALQTGGPKCAWEGEPWGPVKVSECTVEGGTIPDLKYRMEGLPDWVEFNPDTLEISLKGVAGIPTYPPEINVTSTCYSDELELEASITFNLVDCDGAGASDEDENVRDEVTYVSSSGTITPTEESVDAFRPPYDTGDARKVPNGIVAIAAGMDSKNPNDDRSDSDGDGIDNFTEITDDTDVFIRTSAGTDLSETIYANISRVHGIASGDFTNDGYLDLVVGTLVGSRIALYTNDGAGAFPSVGYSAAMGPGPITTLAAADFNSDGNMDVVALMVDDDTFVTAYGDGAGKLNLEQTFVPTSPRAAAVGDFNGDGFVDIAVLVEVNVQIYLWNANTSQFGLSHTYVAGGNPRDMNLMDYNKDNIPDLAVAERVGRRVLLYFGDGNGGFTPSATTLDTGAASNPACMTSGDFDNDGNPDIIVGNQTAVLVGFFGNGDGTFDPHVDWAITGETNRIGAADFDGDNDIDLAMLDPLNNRLVIGINTFRAFQTVDFIEHLFNLTAQPLAFATADYDNNNILDFAVTIDDILPPNDVVSVFLQQ